MMKWPSGQDVDHSSTLKPLPSAFWEVTDSLAELPAFRPLPSRGSPGPATPPDAAAARVPPHRRKPLPYWLTLLLLMAASVVVGAGLKAAYLVYDTEGSFLDRTASRSGDLVYAALAGALRLGEGLRAAEMRILAELAGTTTAPPEDSGLAKPVTASLVPAAVTIAALPLAAPPDVAEPIDEPMPARPGAAEPPPVAEISPAPVVERPPAVEPPARKMDPAEVAILRDRGNELLRRHDIGAARLFFIRAADGGDAASAVGVAKTFDPAFLRGIGAVGFNGDRGEAAYWYGRARDLGDEKAAALLRSLPPG